MRFCVIFALVALICSHGVCAKSKNDWRVIGSEEVHLPDEVLRRAAIEEGEHNNFHHKREFFVALAAQQETYSESEISNEMPDLFSQTEPEEADKVNKFQTRTTYALEKASELHY